MTLTNYAVLKNLRVSTEEVLIVSINHEIMVVGEKLWKQACKSGEISNSSSILDMQMTKMQVKHWLISW